MTTSVAVIGGGLAGIAAATTLQRSGIETTVFEAERTVGGRAITTSKGDFHFDAGALTLSPAYAETISLVEQAGRGDLLRRFAPVIGLVRGGVREIDLSRPARSLVSGRIYSAASLFRLAALLPKLSQTWALSNFHDMGLLQDHDTESCRAYAMRVLGQELHDYLVDPLIRVNMFSDTATSSVVDLFWLLRIFAGSEMIQVAGGMGQLSAALAASLDVRTGARVDAVTCNADGGVTIHQGGQTQNFSAAVVATPPPVAAALTKGHDTPQRRWLVAARPVRSMAVQIGLSDRPPVRAALVMVPTSQAPDVLAVVLDHNKMADRCPATKAIVTLHMTAEWRDRHDAAEDKDVAASALEAARPVLGNLPGEIEAIHIQRWDFVDHQRPVGTYRALAEARFGDQRPPILFAGSCISSGIEGAVISGQQSARAILAHR